MMKTKVLKLSPDYKFKLFGITCSDDDYRISWQLSNKLNIDIKRSNDLEIINEKLKETQKFSVYESFDELNNCIVKIISNKSTLGFLIEELKNIDFFILFFEPINKESINNVYKTIKSIDTISAVFQLEIEKLKSKEKLLF